MEFLTMLLGFLPWVIGVGLLVGLFIISYVKAPPDTAFIISGLKKGKKGENGKQDELNGRVIVGSAAFRIPFLERIDKLAVGIIPIDLKTKSEIPTIEYINVMVDGTANIKVAPDEQSILKAAQNFLGKTPEQIANMIQEVLQGNVREIVGQMKLSELIQKKDIFTQKVYESAVDDMERMGLVIVNMNIQDLTDNNDAIKNLGIDNIVKLSKDAAISRANAEKDIAVAQAEAAQTANASKALSAKKIAEQNKDVEIAKSLYKKEMDTKKAEADASYDIQKQQQRKTIETESVNADIARREKEVELAEKELH